MRRFLAAVVGVTALVGAACGGDDPELSETGARELSSSVAELRAAAAARDAARVQAHLGVIRSTVGALQRSDDISEERAQEVLDSAVEVERSIRVITTTTTTTAPPPPPVPRGRDGDKQEEKKKDKDD